MIQILSEQIINKMAAGQVVERPYNALKELVENSIDANATQIYILLQGGGLDRFEISDNGEGILFEDFPLLCSRHATSKIKSLEDMYQVRSYGFRGEALASLSHVADVEIVSRYYKQKDNTAYKARFKDEVMIIDKIGAPYQVQRKTQGTTIVASNMFNDLKSRRKSQSANQEKKLIKKLIFQMGLNHPKIKFTLETQQNGSQVHLDYSASQQIKDSNQARVLIFSEMTNLNKNNFILCQTSDLLQDGSSKVLGIFSKLNTWQKWSQVYLCVNNRIVESQILTKIIDRAYQQASQAIHQDKHSYCVYLSLQINPERIDFNRHPCKKQIAFHKGQDIFKSLMKWIESRLQETGVIKFLDQGMPNGSAESRKMPNQNYSQQLLKSNCNIDNLKGDDKNKDFVFKKQNVSSLSSNISENLLPIKSQLSYRMTNDYDCNRNRSDSKQLPIQYFYKNISTLNSQLLSNHRNEDSQHAQNKKQNQNCMKEKNNQIFSKMTQQNISYFTHPYTNDPYQLSQQKTQNLKLKHFFQNISFVGCFNLTYIFIQKGSQLFYLNIYPFVRAFIRQCLNENKVIIVKHKKLNLQQQNNKCQQQSDFLKSTGGGYFINKELFKFIRENIDTYECQNQQSLVNRHQKIYQAVIKGILHDQQHLKNTYGIQIDPNNFQLLSYPLLSKVFKDECPNIQEIIYFLIKMYAQDLLIQSESPQENHLSLFLDILASPFMGVQGSYDRNQQKDNNQQVFKDHSHQQIDRQYTLSTNIKQYNNFFRNDFFPTIKLKAKFYTKEYDPETFSAQEFMQQMMDLKDAYKMFERC